MIVHRLLALSVAMLVSAQAPFQGAPDAPDWTNAQPLSVKLSNFKFDPSTVDLKQGQPYDLKLENLSSGGHSFAAKDFFDAALIMEADQGKIIGGKVSLEGGQSIDIHLVARRAGTYKLRCTHFMHGAFGMTGEIVVQ